MFGLFKKKEHQYSFKKERTLENRKEEAQKILSKTKLRIPVIVEKYSNDSKLQTLDQNKFLFMSHSNYGDFLKLLKDKMKLEKEQTLFVFFGNNKLYVAGTTMAQIYDDCKDEDGFLYAMYSTENIFG